MNHVVRKLSLGGLAVLGAGSAEAVVLGSAVMNVDQTYTYSYEIDNSAGSFDVFLFSLEFDFSVLQRDWNPVDSLLGGDVVTPLQSPSDFNDNWAAESGTPVTGMFAQDFFAVGVFGEGDVLVGQSLGGFSFTSSLRPGQVAYTEFAPGGQSASGSVVGPIPEPSLATLILFSLPIVLRRSRCD